MGKHGERKKLWPGLLGLLGVALALLALIALLILKPDQPADPPPPPCQYSAENVTVAVTGPDCISVMRQVVADSDIVWRAASQADGSMFARLTHGQSVMYIYDNGNRPLAYALVGHFAAAQWKQG